MFRAPALRAVPDDGRGARSLHGMRSNLEEEQKPDRVREGARLCKECPAGGHAAPQLKNAGEEELRGGRGDGGD